MATKSSNVIPIDIKDDGCFVYPEASTETIKISKLGKADDSFLLSPIRKKQKLVTSIPVKKSLFNCPQISKNDNETFGDIEVDDIGHDLSSDMINLSLAEQDIEASKQRLYKSEADDDRNIHEVIEINDTEYQEEIKELHNLIPGVLRNLKTENQVETYMKFNKMVAESTFPLTNIGYLLFLDIVNWFSNKSTSQMRYSEDVKRFWRIGLKLFKGRFIRFMGGLKNIGQGETDGVNQGLYQPSESKINFAVPSRQVLDELQSPVSVGSPGIITEMIDTLTGSDPQQIETFKMCVDGKKLNAGLVGQKLGDVNLWGFEQSPSLTEKETRYHEEIAIFDKLKNSLDKIEMKDIKILQQISETENAVVYEEIKDCLHILYGRMNDMRINEVGRQIALEKLMKQVTGDWRTSKLVFAISGVRTYIYDVNSCLLDTLGAVNQFGKAVSTLMETHLIYTTSDIVNLGLQSN